MQLPHQCIGTGVGRGKAIAIRRQILASEVSPRTENVIVGGMTEADNTNTQ